MLQSVCLTIFVFASQGAGVMRSAEFTAIIGVDWDRKSHPLRHRAGALPSDAAVKAAAGTSAGAAGRRQLGLGKKAQDEPWTRVKGLICGGYYRAFSGRLFSIKQCAEVCERQPGCYRFSMDDVHQCRIAAGDDPAGEQQCAPTEYGSNAVLFEFTPYVELRLHLLMDKDSSSQLSLASASARRSPPSSIPAFSYSWLEWRRHPLQFPSHVQSDLPGPDGPERSLLPFCPWQTFATAIAGGASAAGTTVGPFDGSMVFVKEPTFATM